MTHKLQNKVSIRLKSGGHSFSASELSTIAGGESVEVVVLTAKTALVPAEVFSAEHAASYLVDMGLSPAANECIVCSENRNGIVAVMAINRECFDALQRANVGVSYTSPLVDNDSMEQGSVLMLEDGLLYVRVYNEGLRFAEVMECGSDADVLYYLSVVNEAYNIYNMHARAKGDVARLKRVCKGLFKELLCE